MDKSNARVMRRLTTIAAAALLSVMNMLSQEYDHFAAIAEFTGCTSEEDMDQYEVERLGKFIIRPLRINMESQSRIKESGLLTHYQIASLIDYRSRHGDVLSLTELAAVDGFGAAFVRKLAPFISLESSRLPGQGLYDAKHISQELDLKGGVRHNEDLKTDFALKYRIETGENLQAGIAFSKSADSPKPDALTGNLFWHFRRNSGKLAIGDFNARFGQGLALWNGMSISGLNKPSAYLKRASSLSASNSYTGKYAFRGLAVESNVGRLKVTVMTAVTDEKENLGVLPAGNLTWMWRNGQAGLTHYAEFLTKDSGCVIGDMKTSGDFSFTVKGVDLFAEIAYDWASQSTACLAGTVFPAGENIRMAAMLRYYPETYNPSYSAAARALTKCTNEYGASASTEFSGGKWMNINGLDGFGSSVRRIEGAFCCDAAYFPVSKSPDVDKSLQIKSLIEFSMMISDKVALKFRFTERFRTWDIPFRTDIRTDVFYYSRYLDCAFRVNALKCEGIGFLTYAEGTLKLHSAKLSFRTGVFCADNWNDRIYAYERDVPGSFNVPAFYGRGYWLSLSGNWRFARWGKLYARASFTDYPLGEKKKPGKAELKLMLRIEI